MNVIRARTAGFCMGVSLALRALDNALASGLGGRLVMFGPIIHNPQVLRRYADKGVLCLEDPEALRPGDACIIRAHGIPRTVEDVLRRRNVRIIDATCPKVKAAQNAIAAATVGGARLLLFGEAAHPEVQGLLSYAEGGSDVFVDEAYAASVAFAAGEPVVLAAQTTQNKEAFMRVADVISGRNPRLTLLATVCNATERRQTEALDLAGRSDAVIVIGGRSSGNTRRLADVVRVAGVPVFRIETADELPWDSLRGLASVGVTAGASTPPDIIADVCGRLEAL